MKGIYLVAPYATLIVEDKKTLIIKEKQVPEDYLDKEAYLCQDDFVLAVIKLSNEKIITLKEFEELKDKHQISEANRKSWWPDAASLYSYDVEVKEKFEKPKKFDREQGVQNYIQEVKLKKDLDLTYELDFSDFDTKQLSKLFLLLNKIFETTHEKTDISEDSGLLDNLISKLIEVRRETKKTNLQEKQAQLIDVLLKKKND